MGYTPSVDVSHLLRMICRTPTHEGNKRAVTGHEKLEPSHTRGGYDWVMPGYTQDKPKIEARLRRIEGQVRGIQKMVEEDRYCIDVLTQVNATRAALESVALKLLADHTEHCMMEAIQAGGGSKKVRELNDAVERLVRS
jgi:CsoR family transcriptional regulator, copper-sensing transcriptional repressor